MWINNLDDKDNQILALLRENARMSYSDIGANIGLSRTAVKNRIAELEHSGIISGYHAAINLQATPQMTTFITNIETEPAHFDEIRSALIREDQAVTVVQTTGNCHLLAICIASGPLELRDFLSRIYKQVPGIISINAHSVIDIAKGSLLPDNIRIEVREHDQKRTNPETI